MRDHEDHVSDQELLLAADGELPRQRKASVLAHLTACWTCRTRMRDLDGAIAEFVHARNDLMPPLPPPEGPRALLRLRIHEASESSQMALWAQIAFFLRSRAMAIACSVALLLLAGLSVRRAERPAPGRSLASFESAIRSVPDPQLTPGATLPLTRNDICAAGSVETARIVSGDVAKVVFASYGVHAPEPRAYEVDYLITPALGGADNIRNFWPQPYKDTVWNAHIKDALEDHLRGLVCSGQLELATAQQEIALNWISAYKKYFHTDAPLPKHVSFLKDRPWE